LFGDVIGGEMRLTRMGKIVADEWLESVDVRGEIDLDAWVIMPNHVHGIVIIDTSPVDVGAYGHTPLRKTTFQSPSRTLGAMIRGFKGATTIRINAMRGTPRVPVWQRNYHDHIIRDADSLRSIRRYIANNPRRWAADAENPNGERFGGVEDWA
jgi:REP element-mobilizing transposase RayT